MRCDYVYQWFSSEHAARLYTKLLSLEYRGCAAGEAVLLLSDRTGHQDPRPQGRPALLLPTVATKGWSELFLTQQLREQVAHPCELCEATYRWEVLVLRG
jgi:hypothetical protein